MFLHFPYKRDPVVTTYVSVDPTVEITSNLFYHLGSVKVTYVSVDSIVGTYISAINHGRATEILWFRTYVPGSNPHDSNKVF